MSNLDIENELSDLGKNWPGQSIADEVTSRISESAPITDQPARWSKALSHKTLPYWVTVAAAMVVFAAIWQFDPSQSLHAALQKDLQKALSWQVIVKVFTETSEESTGSIWYHKEHGIRIEHSGKVTVDDGVSSYTWFPPTDDSAANATSTVLRCPSSDAVSMVREFCDLSKIPETWTRRPAGDLNRQIGGAPCNAFIYSQNDAEGSRSLQSVVWIDQGQRIRKFILQELLDQEWIDRREVTIDYNAQVGAERFALDFPPEATVVDVGQQLEKRLSLDKALATTVKDGLQLTVHEAIAIDDRSYFLITSVRGTAEYLKQYPPRKRRMNLNYTALDVASQCRSHCSRGRGIQIMMYGFEWQGIDYLWSLFVPELSRRPTGGAQPGHLRIPMQVSHMHENRRDQRGVQLATRCEIDVPVDLSNPSTLEAVVEIARSDMALVVPLYGETSSLPIARSIKDDAVEFTSFDEMDVRQYSDELRKTRWQMETGNWTGSDPPEGFASMFLEEWVEPEDPTKDFKDVDLPLPKQASGKVLDFDGNPIEGARVELEVQQYHPSKQLNPQNFIAHTSSNADGMYQLALAGTVNQKHDQIRIKVSKPGFVTNIEYDYEKRVLQGTLADLKLHIGRKVSGQIVDQMGKPVRGATVRVQSCNEDLSFTWDSGPLPAGDDGSFSMLVPTDSAVAGVVYPQQHAPRHMELRDKEDFGVIRLSKGVRLNGRVLDKDGRGVKNTVVAITGRDPIILHAFLVPIGLAVRTGEDGRFELPALQGQYKLSVTKSASVYAKRRMMVGTNPPQIEPLSIDTAQREPSQSIILQQQ